MKIEINIEGEMRTYTDETPITDIRSLFEYFTKEVMPSGDTDTFGLSMALALHKDATRKDLEDLLEFYYPAEENPEYIPGIKEHLDHAESLYFRLKESFKEADFWFFMRSFYCSELVPNVQKDAIETIKNRGIANLDIETLVHLYPEISAKTLTETISSKKLTEHSFYLETVKIIHTCCIAYAKQGQHSVAQQFFEILEKTTCFKNIIKGQGVFTLTKKIIPRQFGFNDTEPAVMGYAAPDGIAKELIFY